MAEIAFIDKSNLCAFIKSGCDKRDNIRRFGYAMRGERPVNHHFLQQKKIVILAALCSEGMVAVELMSGHVNGDRFFDFVRGSFIPNMMPFDGTNSRSIAIWDNCTTHRVDSVFQEAVILVLWLPPYSPDFNPVENAFSKVIYYIKEHDEVAQVLNDPSPLVRAAFDSFSIHRLDKITVDTESNCI